MTTISKEDQYHIATCPYCTTRNNCGGTKSLMQEKDISSAQDVADLYCEAIELFLVGQISHDKLDKLVKGLTRTHIAATRAEIKFQRSRIVPDAGDWLEPNPDFIPKPARKPIQITPENTQRKLWNSAMLRDVRSCSHEAQREIRKRVSQNDQIVNG